jgi:hypothetical protein
MAHRDRQTIFGVASGYVFSGAACKLLIRRRMSSPNQNGDGVGGEISSNAEESFHGGVTIPFQKVSSAGHSTANGGALLEA